MVLESGDLVRHVEYLRRGDRTDVLLGPWPEVATDGSLSQDSRQHHIVRILRRGASQLALEIDGRRTVIDTEVVDTEISDVEPARSVRTSCPHGSMEWRPRPLFVTHGSSVSGSGPVSPLPGTVIAVEVAEGDQVAEGAVLVVVEAMKMEHRITADYTGVVGCVHFAAGDRVDVGDLLVTVEPLSGSDD